MRTILLPAGLEAFAPTRRQYGEDRVLRAEERGGPWSCPLWPTGRIGPPEPPRLAARRRDLGARRELARVRHLLGRPEHRGSLVSTWRVSHLRQGVRRGVRSKTRKGREDLAGNPDDGDVHVQ